MKVAVPTRGNVVDDHFGHCEIYSVFTFDDSNSIIKAEKLPSPQGCGCKSDIASVLQQMGVTVMLAGNMGQGAFNVLNNHGIRVFRGCSGDVKKVAEDFARGSIADSNVSCHHHDHHHGEGHEHGHTCNH